MEQAVHVRPNRRAGWSNQEIELLWEAADEAQMEGIPLKQVFEDLAGKTGRRPNSIRNFYYAQVQKRTDGKGHTARFVPFTEPEIYDLMEKVLRARAQGQSVRACLQQMANGDHSLMLRYQNKYRSVLKSRPELVSSIIEKLKAEGVECERPEVRSRAHMPLEAAAGQLRTAARAVGDAELSRACEALTSLMLASRMPDTQLQADRMQVRLDLYRLALSEQAESMQRLTEAAGELTGRIKEFAVLEENARREQVNEFVERLTESIGTLESRITEIEMQPVSVSM